MVIFSAAFFLFIVWAVHLNSADVPRGSLFFALRFRTEDALEKELFTLCRKHKESFPSLEKEFLTLGAISKKSYQNNKPLSYTKYTFPIINHSTEHFPSVTVYLDANNHIELCVGSFSDRALHIQNLNKK
jgi:hypothetical protein